MTRFDSLDAIKAFAGDDAEAAHVAPHARKLLAHWEARCAHYEIVIAQGA